MLTETSLVPRAASCVLRVISRVDADCCSTADATATAMPFISVIVAPIVRIAATACCVTRWISPICPAISSVALAVWPARLFTSPATTAKPRPASPARAASIVALRARRLVWLAVD